MHTQRIIGIIAVLGLALAAGCSQSEYGDLGHVTGTVTLDGQPYPNALVNFAPVSGGRSSQGITDQAGRYELIYIRTTRGAEPGQHKVIVTTVPAEESGMENRRGKQPVEVLPARYNTRSELIHQVERGPNTIDLDLKSK